jgi:hypothetical protein
LEWNSQVVAARCALQRAPILGLPEVGRLVASPEGRRSLDARYAALLNAHYADPRLRDQVFVSTAIFKDGHDVAKMVGEWVSADPDSAYANLAAGLHKLGAAQAVRGEGSAQATPDGDMKTMAEVASEASVFLEKAWTLEPRLSPACEALVTVQRMTAGGRVAATTARECVKRDPASYFVVMAWQGSQEPRWGGAPEGFDDVDKHIEKHSPTNPLLSSIRTVIQADPYIGIPEEHLLSVLGELEQAIRNGPNSLVLNNISAAYYQQGDAENGLAYLSQAVRFNIGASRYRAVRAQRNLASRPSWSVIDFGFLLEDDPTSIYYRYLLDTAKQFVGRRKSGSAPKPGESITLDGDGLGKAIILSQCEEFILSGKSDPVMNECADQVVTEWPHDPDAWRVRAEILHHQKKPGATAAAKRYLELADTGSPAYKIIAHRFNAWIPAGD